MWAPGRGRQAVQRAARQPLPNRRIASLSSSQLRRSLRPARRWRRGVDPRVQPRVLQSRVPCAVPPWHVLRPVARNRQAEGEQGGTGEALRNQPRRVRRSARAGRDGEPPAGRALQSAPPPQPRAVQGRPAEQRHHDVQRLSGAEGEPVGRVVPEQVDEEARERVLAHLYQDWRSFCGFGRFSGSGMPVTC